MGLGAAAAMAMARGDPSADYGSIAAVVLFVALMCVCIIVGHLLEANRWMNESITALFIGLGTGVVILVASGGKHSRVLMFSEDLFFIYLLPPIIFNAGFQVKKKQFFRNLITITLFGAVGTLISFTIISLGALGLISRLNIGALELGDYLALGAIFSATDSVCTLQVLSQDETPFLYSLVFGEGVVNDATSVVLFNAIQNFDLGDISGAKLLNFIGSFLYLFGTSTILGVASGLLSAYIIKKLYFGRHSTDREVSIMMLMAYLSYMLAELLDLSGILTVFFCGHRSACRQIKFASWALVPSLTTNIIRSSPSWSDPSRRYLSPVLIQLSTPVICLRHLQLIHHLELPCPTLPIVGWPTTAMKFVNTCRCLEALAAAAGLLQGTTRRSSRRWPFSSGEHAVICASSFVLSHVQAKRAAMRITDVSEKQSDISYRSVIREC